MSCHPLFNADLMPSIHQGTIKQTIKYAGSRAELAHRYFSERNTRGVKCKLLCGRGVNVALSLGNSLYRSHVTFPRDRSTRLTRGLRFARVAQGFLKNARMRYIRGDATSSYRNRSFVTQSRLVDRETPPSCARKSTEKAGKKSKRSGTRFARERSWQARFYRFPLRGSVVQHRSNTFPSGLRADPDVGR